MINQDVQNAGDTENQENIRVSLQKRWARKIQYIPGDKVGNSGEWAPKELMPKFPRIKCVVSIKNERIESRWKALGKNE